MINIEQTVEFIKIAHAGVVDKGGKPYYLHPIAVMNRLPPDVSDEVRLAALLHDVVEDTDYDIPYLRTMGYSETTLDIVTLVTRNKDDGKTYLEWIQTIADSGNIGAIRVKKADNEENSDPERIAQLPVEMQSIVNRYRRSLKILNSKL